MSGTPRHGGLPDWLGGRFQPLPDDVDWNGLAAGLDIETHFHSVVGLASEVLGGADPWADVALPPTMLTDEQRRGLS